MKATLVLLPLLGITYMLFFVNPGEDEVSRVVFIYFNSFLESFQVPPPAPRSGPGCPPTSFSGDSSRQGSGGAGGSGEEGGGGLEVGWGHTCRRPLTHLLCPPQGFFVSVFYCFLNSEVRTPGSQSSGRRGPVGTRDCLQPPPALHVPAISSPPLGP